MKYEKLFKKVSSYLAALFAGYEIHEQVDSHTNQQLVPYVEKTISQGHSDIDEGPSEIKILLIALLMAKIIIGVVILLIWSHFKKTSKKVRRSLDA